MNKSKSSRGICTNSKEEASFHSRVLAVVAWQSIAGITATSYLPLPTSSALKSQTETYQVSNHRGSSWETKGVKKVKAAVSDILTTSQGLENRHSRYSQLSNTRLTTKKVPKAQPRASEHGCVTSAEEETPLSRKKESKKRRWGRDTVKTYGNSDALPGRVIIRVVLSFRHCRCCSYVRIVRGCVMASTI